tara:strand:+ start:488 stop:1081 length:594 start_codon:yes stop_codon:yes gene_type:complete
MDKTIALLDAFKTQVESEKGLFKGPVMVNLRGKGDVKWIANTNSIDKLFANLKRTASPKESVVELSKLMASIKANKFASQFKYFVKFYTNSQYASTDVNIGQCPKISTTIPYNTHMHDKKYFTLIIIEWYVSYFAWIIKMKEKQMEVSNTKQKQLMENAKTYGKWETPTIKEEEEEEKEDEEEEKEDERVVPDSWDF